MIPHIGKIKGNPNDFAAKYGQPHLTKVEYVEDENLPYGPKKPILVPRDFKPAPDPLEKERREWVRKGHLPIPGEPIRMAVPKWKLPLVWLALKIGIGAVKNEDSKWGSVGHHNINRWFFYCLGPIKIKLAGMTFWDVQYLLAAHTFGKEDISWADLPYSAESFDHPKDPLNPKPTNIHNSCVTIYTKKKDTK